MNPTIVLALATPDEIGLVPHPERGAAAFADWLSENAWWLIASILTFIILVMIIRQVAAHVGGKRLERDALVKLKKNLVRSCENNRGPAKRVRLTGGPGDPSTDRGRYVGHHKSCDATLVALRPGFFKEKEAIICNPVDVTGLDTREVHLISVGVEYHRDFGFSVPDVHDPIRRQKWSQSLGIPIHSAAEMTDLWRQWMSDTLDNLVAFYDSCNATEDRSYLRQEVTRGKAEGANPLSETVPDRAASPNPQAQEARR